MVQSMKPKSTHGEQLYRMFCFDFDRPNCLGRDLAANHLVNYAKQFMTAYSDFLPPSNGDAPDEDEIQPWAAFLSFIDSHEDTMTVVSYLDGMFVEFLQSIDYDNTIVLLSSDHGLHYGPSFASNGERERIEPILYMHFPESMLTMLDREALSNNKDSWVTPFDVHETILHAAIQKISNGGKLGSSLLNPLSNSRQSCEETTTIPSRYCTMLNEQNHDGKRCSFMTSPPSILSFAADIPRWKRPSWPKCEKADIHDIQSDRCLCATNLAQPDKFWYPCNSEKFQSRMNSREMIKNPLRMKTCEHDRSSNTHTMEVNISVNEDPQLSGSLHKMRSFPDDQGVTPNILFLEIDSVSQRAASRHLQKTLSVLKSHQITKRKEDGKVWCPSGFCAAVFKNTGIVGQNSIPNQLAALSGCIDQNLTTIDSYMRPILKKKRIQLEAWCPKSDEENPWIYNVAKKLGYVTFFGEEFCYSHSPWVVQDNLFKLDADYHMNSLFCQLARAAKDKNKKLKRTPLFLIEHDTSSKPQPCVDGRSRQEFSFEYIRGIWDAYPKTPKFAYLNSMAAHDYSIDLAYQPLGLESYDDYLSEFLKEMLGRTDANNTVIILRSDHGLQGGPAPIDFSAQVEHINPFNTLILPDNMKGMSVNDLFINQDRLVTGYDLYNTMRNILDGSSTDSRESNGIPKWSHNVIKETIPSGRSCIDAKIPSEFCPCLEERSDLMPYYYVGQSEKLRSIEKPEFIEGRDVVLEPILLPGKKQTPWIQKELKRRKNELEELTKEIASLGNEFLTPE